MSPENVELLLQILGVLLFILFCVALAMSYKSWRAHTLILVFLVFSAACTFFGMAVCTLKTHQAWREILVGPPGQPEEGLISKTEKLEEENHELEFGKETPGGKVDVQGIKQVEQHLRKLAYERGRIWADCKPGTMAPGAPEVQVTIAQPSPHQILPKTVVYAFDGATIGNGGTYLGEFRVKAAAEAEAAGASTGGAAPAEGAAAAAAPGSITLEPAWKMDDFETQRLVQSANRGGPWIIYDKIPADSHEVFADTDTMAADEIGVDASALAGMDRVARLQKLLPSAVVTEYIKDQQEADAGDPDPRVQVKVEFRDNHEFDDFSKALSDKPDQFRKDRQVWLLRESINKTTNSVVRVDDLAAQNVLRIIDSEKPRYKRELRDYGHAFLRMYVDRGRKRDEIVDVQFDGQVLDDVLKGKLVVVQRWEEEKARLEHDRDGFVRDQQLITKVLTDLRRQAYAMGRLMNRLRQENYVLADRLDKMQMKAVDGINRKSPSPQAGPTPPSGTTASNGAAAPR